VAARSPHRLARSRRPRTRRAAWKKHVNRTDDSSCDTPCTADVELNAATTLRVDFVRHCDRSRQCAGPPHAPRAIRTASSDRACKRLTVHSIASGASAMLGTVLPFIAALCVACLCCGSAATAADFADETIEVANTKRRYLVHDFS